MRITLAILTWLLVHSAGTAGVIHWSFSSSDSTAEDYSITGTSGSMESLSGATVPINILGGFASPDLVSPIPVEGPTLYSTLTITDSNSGIPWLVWLPIQFYDNETAPDGEFDRHIVRYGGFDPIVLELGSNRYVLTTDTENIYVQVNSITQTPEPSTLAISAIGALCLGLKWRRRRSA
jgi:hypothetical protein